VRMTNIAQMVNVLQAMILTDKEKMLLTPTYYAYKMYVPFQEATFLPVQIAGNPDYVLGESKIPQVSVSAAKSADGRILLALVNVHPNKKADLALSGKWSKANGEILTAGQMDSHNTFAQKDVVKPKPFKVQAKNGQVKVELPAKSLVVLQLN